MQSSNRLLGDIARLASGAMTMAAGAKTELEQLIQQRVERFLSEKGLSLIHISEPTRL